MAQNVVLVCSCCKKIRADKGSWNRLEFYIRDRSEASFTHGICPECAQEFYGHVLSRDPMRQNASAV